MRRRWRSDAAERFQSSRIALHP